MAETLRIQTPGVFRTLWNPARYKGAWGGRGSGKSHAFADMLIARCLKHPGTRAVCVREIQRSLADSVKRLLDDKIIKHGLTGQFRSLVSHIETPGDGIIIFQGLQDHTADSIKSLEGFDVAWVEEAQSLSDRSLKLLRPTIRKEGSELWFSWNPRNESDPIDQLLRGSDVPPGSLVVRVNFTDNEWFPAVLRAEMEWDRSRDPEKYAHVWLGEYERKSEARVFKNWRVEAFDTPKGVAFLYGGDWGFSTDPTVLVRAWLKDQRTLMIDAEVYRVGCEIDDTPALFDMLGCAACRPTYSAAQSRACHGAGHGSARAGIVTADSARPETISYVRRNGYPRIEPARKGAGSVEEGVTFLQNYNIVVHPRCQHAIDELSVYSYKVDKLTSQILPVLEDKKNHVIDSLRYAVERVRKPAVRVREAVW